jgi:hypothetical protein
VAKPLVITLPPNLFLSGDYIVRVAALDPTTGAIVSGVNVSNVNLQVQQFAGGSLASGTYKPVMLRTKATSGNLAS